MTEGQSGGRRYRLVWTLQQPAHCCLAVLLQDQEGAVRQSPGYLHYTKDFTCPSMFSHNKIILWFAFSILVEPVSHLYPCQHYILPEPVANLFQLPVPTISFVFCLVPEWASGCAKACLSVGFSKWIWRICFLYVACEFLQALTTLFGVERQRLSVLRQSLLGRWMSACCLPTGTWHT